MYMWASKTPQSFAGIIFHLSYLSFTVIILFLSQPFSEQQQALLNPSLSLLILLFASQACRSLYKRIIMKNPSKLGFSWSILAHSHPTSHGIRERDREGSASQQKWRVFFCLPSFSFFLSVNLCREAVETFWYRHCVSSTSLSPF